MAVDEVAVRNFYASRNPSKLPLVRDIVDEANALGLSHDFLMQSLLDKYGPSPAAAAPAAVVVTPAVVPTKTPSSAAPVEPVASAAPQCPAAAQRILSPAVGGTTGRPQQEQRTPSAAAPTDQSTDASPYGGARWAKTDSAAARSHTEHVLQEEVRGWLLDVLEGINRPVELDLLRNAANPVDALRNGALLVALVARLKTPGCETPHIASGTNQYVHLSNIDLFMRAAAGWVPPTCLFVGTDLCSGKNDRSVITCLLALGRWALDHGRVAPRVSQMEREIDNLKPPTEDEIAVAIANAEVVDEQSPFVDERDIDEDNIDFAVAAVLGPSSTTAPEPVIEPTPVAAQPAARPILTITPTAPQQASSPTAREVASPKRYRAAANDKVDERVGKSFNSFLAVMHREGRRVHSRIIRTRQGEYVIYHRITQKRTTVYVRELSNALMVRVGGGWEDFDAYLARRLVDVEVLPRGTIEERDRIARRRGNSLALH